MTLNNMLSLFLSGEKRQGVDGNHIVSKRKLTPKPFSFAKISGHFILPGLLNATAEVLYKTKSSRAMEGGQA